jgi:hypothetical protein
MGTAELGNVAANRAFARVSPVQGVGGQDSLYSIISSLSQLVNMQEQLFF